MKYYIRREVVTSENEIFIVEYNGEVDNLLYAMTDQTLNLMAKKLGLDVDGDDIIINWNYRGMDTSMKKHISIWRLIHERPIIIDK